MKTAGIRAFRAQLSSYLRDVRAGETVLVTERGRVIAEVRPPFSKEPAVDEKAQRRQAMIESGFLRPALTSPEERACFWANFRGQGLPAGTSEALLAAEREEKW